MLEKCSGMAFMIFKGGMASVNTVQAGPWELEVRNSERETEEMKELRPGCRTLKQGGWCSQQK